MAKLTTIYCTVCNTSKQEARSYSNLYSTICYECEIKETSKKERIWKAGREGMTLKERIRELEHFMYHHGEHYEGPVVFG